MTPDDFHFLARLLRRRCGLSLNLGRMALVERRLAPVTRRFGFKDMDGLLRELRLGRETLAEAVTEAMTTNESSFFRDPAMFAALRDRVLPRLVAARAATRRLRLWSAATAAGQEAYSIAIILAEMGLAQDGWSIDLIATDFSALALARAEAGRYGAHEVQRGLDPAMIARHFHNDGADWRIDDALRRMIQFRRFNLLDSFGWLDDLDIVLCRNVLLYFDRGTRASVLERIADTLVPDGLLVLGDSEMPELLNPGFAPAADGPCIYARTGAAIARTG